MKRKSYLSIILALALLLLLSVSAFADDAAASPKQQLQLIASQIDSLKQTNTENPWYYTVTDLDHNGRLEFVAASQHPHDRSTNLKIWSVSKDGTSLEVCRLDKAEDESFPDIMTDTVDTYHVQDTDTWYYMVYDNVVISDNEVYTVKTAVNLKNGTVGYDAYAVEHTVAENGTKNVTHTDTNGISISAEQYNGSGANAFVGADRSNTAFEWLTADKINDPDRLTESFEVFLGTREPTEIFPVPKPVALGGTGTAAPAPSPSPAPIPVPTPQPQPQPVTPTYLTITKNPTNENRAVGGNAIFVACANAYESLNWTFVSPDGGQYSPASFVSGSGASVSGEYSTTITVSGVESWMNGWGAYCTFYYRGQTARTSTAYIYVTGKSYETPDWNVTYGSMSGTAYRDSQSTLAIYLQNGTMLYLPSYSSGGYTCNISGEVSAAGGGASCMVYYRNSPTVDNIYQLDVWGSYAVVVEPANGSSTTVIVPDYSYYDDYGGGDSGYYDYFTEDGVYVTVDREGNETFFGVDGSWFSFHSDGTWTSYDYETDTLDSGITWD